MKTPDQLKQEALARAAQGGKVLIDPNSQAAREMMALQQAQAMAARLVIEAASSIFVRIVSDMTVKLGGIDTETDGESYKAVAREAFKAAKAFLEVANEPAPELKPVEQPATDANGSPVELEG